MTLRISDFSRVGRVSRKALRYYDELGLLKPARVDASTGYRYYSLDQLPRLNRILALKDLDLSLEQVRRLLEGGHSADRLLRGMLELKQAELEQRVLDDRERLARVRARLRQSERGGTAFAHEVVVKPVEPVTAATVREVAPTIGHMTALIREVMEALADRSVRHAGPDFTIFYHDDFREEDLDVEVVVPVDESRVVDIALPRESRLTTRTVPGEASMASLVYRGGYETLLEPYTEMGRWVEANGYRVDGPGREVYLRGPHEGQPVTEIQFPVERRRSGELLPPSSTT